MNVAPRSALLEVTIELGLHLAAAPPGGRSIILDTRFCPFMVKELSASSDLRVQVRPPLSGLILLFLRAAGGPARDSWIRLAFQWPLDSSSDFRPGSLSIPFHVPMLLRRARPGTPPALARLPSVIVQSSEPGAIHLGGVGTRASVEGTLLGALVVPTSQELATIVGSTVLLTARAQRLVSARALDVLDGMVTDIRRFLALSLGVAPAVRPVIATAQDYAGGLFQPPGPVLVLSDEDLMNPHPTEGMHFALARRLAHAWIGTLLEIEGPGARDLTYGMCDALGILWVQECIGASPTALVSWFQKRRTRNRIAGWWPAMQGYTNPRASAAITIRTLALLDRPGGTAHLARHVGEWAGSRVHSRDVKRMLAG